MPTATHTDAVQFITDQAGWEGRVMPERSGFGPYRTCNHFTVTAGRPMVPHRKPKRLFWGTPRYCYANCHRVCSGRHPSRYLYAEGLAVTDDVPFPFPHAWVVDRKTGQAHEITIRDKLPLAFFGLVFTPSYSAARWREDLSGSGECCGPLIDAWTNRWPLLRMTPEELAAVTIKEFPWLPI